MIPCFPRHVRRIRLEWRTVRSIVKRILVTCAATTALALLLTMVLCALGNAMAPKWQVEPFTDHITLTTTNTAIQAVDPATGAVLKTPQEGAYRTKETHITVALDGGKTVNAIVREPLDAPADRPACLFLHGSGTGKSSEAFGDVANAMASAGITTLVPDKRLDNYTMLHRDYVSSAHDYAKSLEILRKWPGVSRSETGIYAESEGTWIATVLTQQHPDLAFAILTSPPAVSGRQQMTLAATNYLTAAGAPDAVKQLIPRITSLGTQRMGLAYADFDAAKYRTSLTMPLLINYGVKDTAMPVEQGARLLIKAANHAGNTNVTLRYYDANHQLRTGSNQTVPGLPLEPHYTHDLEDWINAVTSGTGANGWATPMIAGAQPNQTVAAPLKTPPALVKSMGVIVGAIAVCLLCALLAMCGAPILLIAGWVRERRASRRVSHDSASTEPAEPTDSTSMFSTDATTSTGPSTQPNAARPIAITDHRFPVGMRVALALNTLLAVGTTGVFLAYLVTVIIDAISLTDNSAVLAKNWHAIVMLTWLSLVAFAWLLAEIIVDACRRHARNRAIASIDDDADMNNGHDAAAGSRCDIGKDGKACIGSGHVIVATCVVVSAALSLALLAFWGLFC